MNASNLMRIDAIFWSTSEHIQERNRSSVTSVDSTSQSAVTGILTCLCTPKKSLTNVLSVEDYLHANKLLRYMLPNVVRPGICTLLPRLKRRSSSGVTSVENHSDERVAWTFTSGNTAVRNHTCASSVKNYSEGCDDSKLTLWCTFLNELCFGTSRMVMTSYQPQPIWGWNLIGALFLPFQTFPKCKAPMELWCANTPDHTSAWFVTNGSNVANTWLCTAWYTVVRNLSSAKSVDEDSGKRLFSTITPTLILVRNPTSVTCVIKPSRRSRIWIPTPGRILEKNHISVPTVANTLHHEEIWTVIYQCIPRKDCISAKLVAGHSRGSKTSTRTGWFTMIRRTTVAGVRSHSRPNGHWNAIKISILRQKAMLV